ncbi:hypothetical protein mRhiFer1_008706 [Rhinolophus ferrumequinum]|uniref:Uncharacterized protein n=1 Tax=Rhinolophus ferrumequinum TaxID=59479 RepID=A0A7J7TQE3_RHIFE|nr:hypothetical protein mRhiFer1_008706 [Rhinolophus ferrumequinum]
MQILSIFNPKNRLENCRGPKLRHTTQLFAGPVTCTAFSLHHPAPPSVARIFFSFAFITHLIGTTISLCSIHPFSKLWENFPEFSLSSLGSTLGQSSFISCWLVREPRLEVSSQATVPSVVAFLFREDILWDTPDSIHSSTKYFIIREIP